MKCDDSLPKEEELDGVVCACGEGGRIEDTTLNTNRYLFDCEQRSQGERRRADCVGSL